MRAGSRLVWLVDPETEAVMVYTPGNALSVHHPPEVIDAWPVLRDFHLDLAALFAVLPNDEE